MRMSRIEPLALKPLVKAHGAPVQRARELEAGFARKVFHFIVGFQRLAKQVEMTEAEGSPLQSRKQGQAEATALEAIGDRHGELATPAHPIEPIACLANDDVAPLH